MAPDIISINALLSALAGAGKLVGFHLFTHFPHPLNIPFCYMITYDHIWSPCGEIGALYEDIQHILKPMLLNPWICIYCSSYLFINFMIQLRLRIVHFHILSILQDGDVDNSDIVGQIFINECTWMSHLDTPPGPIVFLAFQDQEVALGVWYVLLWDWEVVWDFP